MPLSLDDEILLTLNFGQANRLIEANVQYRARIDGMWHEVCRYDNAHGPPHVHRFWQHPTERSLPGKLSPSQLLSKAEQDLKTNWRKYRARMEAKTYRG